MKAANTTQHTPLPILAVKARKVIIYSPSTSFPMFDALNGITNNGMFTHSQLID